MTSVLQLFMKAPVPGLVKTRMHPHLSFMQAARLHEILCTRILQALHDLPDITTEVWAAGDTLHPFFVDLRQRFGVSVLLQAEGDLGARMQASLADGLSRADRVVIVGGDCLSVDGAYVQDAFRHLCASGRAVLGPADDGGYVLVGANELRAGLFANVAWGSDQALVQTRANLMHLGYDVTLLAPRWDIDTYRDLQTHAPGLLRELSRYA